MLRDPSGIELDLDDPPDNVRVQWTTTQVLVEIESPEEGAWTLSVDGASPSPYSVGLGGDGEPMGEADFEELLTFPQAATLRVRVEDGWAVSGCRCRTVIRRSLGAPDNFLDLAILDPGQTSFTDSVKEDYGQLSTRRGPLPASRLW